MDGVLADFRSAFRALARPDAADTHTNGYSPSTDSPLEPSEIRQLWDVIAHGYWHARRLDYSMTGAFHALEWVRVAGDTVFLVLGALPIAIGALRSGVWALGQARSSPGRAA